MSNSPISREVVIQNELGMHMRPAEIFGRMAQQFQSKIEVVRDSHRVDGKSLIDLITLGAGKGTKLTIEAVGPDAQAALDALVKVVEVEFPKEDTEKDAR
jgi:phosphotransferase system HPr (HPr) family protein